MTTTELTTELKNRIQDFCRKQEYADFVIEDGLDCLVPTWESTVDHIARGYADAAMMFEEYLNDMDTRQILYEIFQITPELTGSTVAARIAAADEVYFAHTVAIDACIWGERNEKQYGYSPQVQWWYYRKPATREADRWRTL